MKITETWQGSRVVFTICNSPKHYNSRLYVNHGETATLTHANHKTKKGAIRWANKVLTQ